MINYLLENPSIVSNIETGVAAASALLLLVTTYIIIKE